MQHVGPERMHSAIIAKKKNGENKIMHGGGRLAIT
jgi:hypothetical protein